tara:strand:+ start:7639 stop:9414 length:1776 start_codon:yes stop_codon:yes gene_type:complete
MQNLKKILFLLSSQERKHAALLMVMIIIMAFLDMIGVASILPFMAVVTNPSIIETNLILNTMYQYSSLFGVENNQQFIFALGVLVFILLVFSLGFKTLTTYLQVRFVSMSEYTIGKRLMKGYLCQPYSWFLSRHSADLGKIILSEVGQVIGNGIRPIIELIAKGLTTIALIALLVLVDPRLTLIIGLSMSLVYLFIFYFVRNFLKRTGEERLNNNQLRFKAISEAFGAAKEVKIGGLEKTFIENFSNSAQVVAKSVASSQIIGQLPRFILEAIAFGGILLIILYSISETGSFSSAIPVISLFVFAGYRLLPSIQHIYASFTQLVFIGSSIDRLYNDLKNLKTFNKKQEQGILPFNKTISLKNVCYNYPNSSRTTLKDLNLSIPAKSIIGLVGATGCGKTTTIDIILGLLTPQMGTLEVDGKVITEQNTRSWQRLIGYVPQHIYLSDDTVAANIAFGMEPENIDQDMIEKVSKIANLHEFVINDLPQKYNTEIGERGVRLSGGQRQRIGIARALYHSPKVLVLDEATSALDNQTEKAVMDAVNNLGKDITIILIAHRLNTVKNCDIIYKLDNGQIIDQGTFNDPTDSNNNFS